MQINSINNQSFKAKIVGDYYKITEAARKNGVSEEKINEATKYLINDIPDNYTIDFDTPKGDALYGNVWLQDEKASAVTTQLHPVIMDSKNVLDFYMDAVKLIVKSGVHKKPNRVKDVY